MDLPSERNLLALAKAGRPQKELYDKRILSKIKSFELELLKKSFFLLVG
jgi:hypothetical protein